MWPVVYSASLFILKLPSGVKKAEFSMKKKKKPEYSSKPKWFFFFETSFVTLLQNAHTRCCRRFSLGQQISKHLMLMTKMNWCVAPDLVLESVNSSKMTSFYRKFMFLEVTNRLNVRKTDHNFMIFAFFFFCYFVSVNSFMLCLCKNNIFKREYCLSGTFIHS